MTPYRATDEQLDREISALEQMGRVRLRRANADLNEIDRELRELRKERARRKAEVLVVSEPVVQTQEVA